MRKIKHFAGYGTVKAGVIKDGSCTLHVRIVGNHECGLRPYWLDNAYEWLVHRFDKTAPAHYDPRKNMSIRYEEGFTNEPNEYGGYTEQIDYYFTY